MCRYKILGCLLFIFLAGLIAWFVRGKYDQFTLLEGRFHMVNLANEAMDVSIEFPSGEKKFFKELGASESVDFTVKNTGEGSIKIYSEGILIDQVGYVTSSNQLIVLSVSKESVIFSQVFLEKK